MEEILLHPERNTSLILRADILSDGSPINAPKPVNHIASYTPTRNLLRRLLPRQRNRDPILDQDCTFFVTWSPGPGDHTSAQNFVLSEENDLPPSSSGDTIRSKESSTQMSPTLVILSPRFASPEDTSLPWYHPPVRHLAFRYIPHPQTSSSSTSSDLNSAAEEPVAFIRLEVVLAEHEHDSPLIMDPSSRLYRTCLALLETVYKYGKGKMNGYKKRVLHDVRRYFLLRKTNRYAVADQDYNIVKRLLCPKKSIKTFT